MSHRSLAVLVVPASLALGGCASSVAPAPAASYEVGERPISDALNYAGVHIQLDVEAQHKLITQCMRDKGFDYHLPPFPPQPVEPFAGIALIGFSSLDPVAPIETGEPVEEHLSPEEQEALVGNDESEEVIVDGKSEGSFSTGGCSSGSHIALSGGLERMKPNRVMVSRLYTGLAEARSAAATAPQVTAAVTGWSACMKQKGHNYQVPSQVVGDRPKNLRLRDWPVAVDDLNCKDAVGLLGAAEIAMAESEQRFVARYPGLIDQWRQDADERYGRVLQVVAGTLTWKDLKK